MGSRQEKAEQSESHPCGKTPGFIPTKNINGRRRKRLSKAKVIPVGKPPGLFRLKI